MLNDKEFEQLVDLLEAVDQLVDAVDGLPSHDINDLPAV